MKIEMNGICSRLFLFSFALNYADYYIFSGTCESKRQYEVGWNLFLSVICMRMFSFFSVFISTSTFIRIINQKFQHDISWRFVVFFTRYAISECLFVIVEFVYSFTRRRIKMFSLGQGSRKLSPFLSTFIVRQSRAPYSLVQNILKFIAKHVEMSFVAQLAW